MNGRYLSITTLFLLFPIIVFVYNTHKPIWQTILVLLLLINIALSFLFWINPIQSSLIHFYDGVFAKISYILFSIYILFIKDINYETRRLAIIILILTFIMFYYSSMYSQKKWGSKEHIVCHSIFHFLSSIGCSIAFI